MSGVIFIYKPNILEIKTTTRFKGKAPDQIKIQTKETVTGKHVAIFDGARSAAIHINDRWYAATPTAKPGNYIITARKTDLDSAFTGSTEDLIKELTNLQAQDTPPPK